MFKTSTASIGIKILLSDLILQINEKNFNIIKEILNNGFLEDENDTFNEEFYKIILNIKNDLDYIDFKEYLTNESKKCISLRARSMLEITDNSSLFDKAFLFPVKEILTTQIYGYDSNASTNSISREMDFDLSVNIDKYKEIKNFDIVFILAHRS